jgi:hypothetical protein
MIVDAYSFEGEKGEYKNIVCEIWPTPKELKTVCLERGVSSEAASQPYTFVRGLLRTGIVTKLSSATSSIARNLPQFGWDIYEHSVKMKHAIRVDNEIIQGKPFQLNEPFVFGKVIKKIEQITKLEPNWDSFNSRPIEINCVSNIVRLLLAIMEWRESLGLNIPAPFVVPTPDGGIQFEWRKELKYIEIATLPSTSDLEFLAIEKVAEGELELEGILKSDDEIKELLYWFVSGPTGSLKCHFDKTSL